MDSGGAGGRRLAAGAGRGGRRLAMVVALLGVAVTGCAAASGAPAAAPGGGAAATASRPPAAASFRSVRTYTAVAAPLRLRIPTAGVDSRLQRLGLAGDGTIQVPTRPDVAGWYTGGPRPGQRGPAVILGHVDWVTGPGVFFHLSELPRGAWVYVDRADGSTARFRVTGTLQVPKSRFPTNRVYAPGGQASLRLVTCGGSFDAATRNYRDNVIVFAALA
jgi:hypothetical protein